MYILIIQIFSPSYRDEEMRLKLSNGNPNQPLLLYVGRLGSEKKLKRLKKVLDSNPGLRLAIVGSGPAEKELKEEFANYPVVFTGQLVGKSVG